MRGNTKVLDVGRSHRLATLKQRRAIIARQDGECAIPGCRNTHLEIHHSIWWSGGGKTNLDDMVGLCTRCHHLVHRDLLKVKADDTGGFTFTNQDNRAVKAAYRQRVANRRAALRIHRNSIKLNAHRQDVLTPQRR